ncbi:exonuclease RecJ [Halobacillus karajensis]|uniref:Single-stranded-DNA-specific exonuclease RecJ n=1 Tax=Halobacillus karajensis TaxID=195088 RepID=A0A024P6P8_9BACI|nr:single-stranded-DNA-specific exonuclease RecJ [Halobacillus karajensis]CDQ18107.1 Single-stranded-DNA-specific exonuclease RecJ [Halobacillus karajensis]CDQ24458.1 Single-stranded-DNA-specific exonuclease RecJ [Halobacillus karajensis]CDQ29294.1 Single-stranded-DNA-specific exonuclease RecJ [Halobacillus karajensis]SEH59144.1 exonuclease RecJ [Halobacillus karajensis]
MIQSKMKWKFTYRDPEESNIGLPGVTPLTQQLLEKRGIMDPAAADSFLNPTIEQLHDPMLMDGMQRAVTRVNDAIASEEPILVFGDYDADGVTSTSVMVEALRKAGALCDFYIPNRFTEGYGPNKEAFQFAFDSGYTLIITVDTGIAAIEEAAFAKELGIDLIITDHHEVQEVLPDAYSIIHPKTSANYPFQELAGVGVAFKFAQSLLGRFPKEFLDLVVIGTIADLVPLKGENRVLAAIGLKAISRSTRPGIQALRKVCNIDGEMNEETIGFSIGPRLNAVGRLQDAGPAVDLLLSENQEEAEQIALFINQLNQERQKIVTAIAKEAEEMVCCKDGEAENVLVVAKEGWNPGVLGIVASKLVRQFDRPAIVLAIDEEKGEAKGSARSIDAFDLFSNCMEVRHRFKHFGGHAQAAGMTLDINQVDGLREDLIQLAQEKLSEEDYQQVLDVETTVDLTDITLKQIEEVNQLRPFGMGNPKPLFHLKHTPKEVRLIGSKKNHLKFQFQSEQTRVDGIAFGMGDLYQQISPHAALDVVGELGINEWNGRKNVQVMIKDLSVKEWQLFDHRGSTHIEKNIMIPPEEAFVAVGFQGETQAPCNLPVVQADSVTQGDSYDGVLLIDLPGRVSEMRDLLTKIKGQKIFVCYHLKESTFLKTWPSRDHFKWFYGMLLKRGSFNLHKEADLLAKRKGWDRSMVEFISEVFFELDFVKMEDGIITVESEPSQKDLQESSLYREREEQLQMERTLYYSTYNELKSWFDQYVNQPVKHVKEEVVNGL